MSQARYDLVARMRTLADAAFIERDRLRSDLTEAHRDWNLTKDALEETCAELAQIRRQNEALVASNHRYLKRARDAEATAKAMTWPPLHLWGTSVSKHGAGYSGAGIVRGYVVANDGSLRIVTGHRIEGGEVEFFHVYTPKQVEVTEAVEPNTDPRDDKIDGLESDLSSAIDVLWRHGDDEARTWIKLNYPKFGSDRPEPPIDEAGAPPLQRIVQVEKFGEGTPHDPISGCLIIARTSQLLTDADVVSLREHLMGWRRVAKRGTHAKD